MQSEKNWYQQAVIYQIYPRSFYDSTGDGVGDIKGIEKKLPYLHSLGINGIWLSPIYQSPMVDNGYDISDYTNIHPLFGTLEDFDQLVNKAHEKGIKVMLDFVPNHTSNQHPWFLESQSSKDNPKHDWYIWKDPKPDGSPPNNWISVFDNTPSAAWEYVPSRNQYYLHSFFKEQPDLNWRNPQVKEAMGDVLRFWMRKGVDGFRIDVLYYLLKDERFLDEPLNPNYQVGVDHPNDKYLHPYSKDQPETLNVMGYFNDVLGEFPNTFMVSETYVSLAETLKIYATSQRGSHAPFNFHLIFQPFEAKAYKTIIDQFQQGLSETNIPVYVFGNHDQSRIATRLGGQKQARLAAMLKLTLPGMPFLYYGDEIGMEDNKEIPPEKKNDKFGALSRDPQRTPMQWSSELHAGFSKAEPWLPIHKNYQKINVKTEEADTASMLSLYKKLLTLRRTNIALLDGRYFPVSVDNEPVLAFMRSYGDTQLLILLNFSDKKQMFRLPYEVTSMIVNTQMDKKSPYTSQYSFELRPFEGSLVQIT